MTQADLKFVDETIARVGRGPDAVVPVLQALQGHYHYLPADALQRVCEISEISPAAITGVSTFYDQFRLAPAGEHRVRVCHGTACHVAGSRLIEAALRLHLGVAEDDDTDPDRRFTVERVACVGCCSLAPVVQIDEQTFGHLTSKSAPDAVREFLERSAKQHEQSPAPPETAAADVGEVQVSLDSCCLVVNSGDVYDQLRRRSNDLRMPVRVRQVGCMGFCRHGPSVRVTDGEAETAYVGLDPSASDDLLHRHFAAPRLIDRLTYNARRGLDRLLGDGDDHDMTAHRITRVDPGIDAFERSQTRIATEHYGRLDPVDLDEYIAHGGFEALRRCRETTGEALIDTLAASGLRGRGGAGYPTAVKWRTVREAEGETRYVICNGDEGDPGAFMDRMLLESFPYRVLEGIAIAAHAVRAEKAFIYVRAEYPLAVQRLHEAIDACERRGLIGGEQSPTIEIRPGAGAFICGEETSLLASIEGRRPTPRLRPPYPAEHGLWGEPTLVNNAETFANVPWIMRHGAKALAGLGTGRSRGTKVFALAGKVKRVGLIEVPMGMTIREIVEEIGGGVSGDRPLKAVQIGGPSGGCVPASLADTPVDYEALRDLGAIMGSGGLIVLDEGDCMVDLARFFLQFTADQSCGKCSMCRIGTRRLLEMLNRLCEGKARRDELDELEHLCAAVQQGSLCGLGRTAPNPVVTAMRYFREEFEAHFERRCPAGRCPSLIRYEITADCVGCTLCAQHCPADAIPMTHYQRHVIDDELCTRCDTCRLICPHEAVEVRS